MSKFLFKIFSKIVFPVFILVFILIVWDPFKVFFNYDDYYNTKMILNREQISQKLLQKRSIKPHNFIIGSSRSQAFRVSYWSKKIDNDSLKFYHYDGIGLGLWRTKNALEFIKNEVGEIHNLLIIVDAYFFEETNQNLESLKIQPPNVSKQDYFLFYWIFIKKSINPSFIYSYLVHFLTGRYYNFMEKYFTNNEKDHLCNSFTNDVKYFEKDSMILADSISYYSTMIKKREFLWERVGNDSMGEPKIFDEQLKILVEINRNLMKHKTKVKIIIGPMFNQVRFNQNDKEILEALFGRGNVYDYSGVNEFTANVGDYYEHLHYRPQLAERILDSIYCKN